MDEVNRAPLNDTPTPRDEANAAGQFADTAISNGSGGGGLFGANAATPGQPEQAATPSNPASPAVAGDAGAVKAQAEAERATLSGGAAGRE